MNPAFVISTACAAIELTVAVFCFTFARAPGWRQVRYFGLISVAAGIYTILDAILTLPSLSVETIHTIGRINICAAAVYVGLWIVYSRVWNDQRVGPVDKLAIGVLGLCSATLLIPGLGTSGIYTLHLPALGATYRTPGLTAAGSAAMSVLALMLLLPAVRFVYPALCGVRKARVPALAFVAMVALGAVEAAVSSGLLLIPYPADIGYLVAILIFASDITRRATRDARRIQRLNRDLKKEVMERTNEAVETREALIHSERNAALGQLAAGVAHEVNNPLASVMGNLSYLQSQTHQHHDDFATAIDDALNGVHRIRRIVTDLSVFSRPEGEIDLSADMTSVVQSASRLVRPHLKHHAKIELVFEDAPPVAISPAKLTQVLVNLLINACHASRDRDSDEEMPTITVAVGRDMNGAGVIEVIDRGIGMPPEVVTRSCEPYFTTKSQAEGTGLGLFICRGIIAAAKGSLEIRSELGLGTTVRIMLPSTEIKPSRPSNVDSISGENSRSKPSAPTQRRELSSSALDEREPLDGARILVIDDEPLVAKSMQRMLLPAQVMLAMGGVAGLEELRRSPLDYDVVLCDLMMPDLNGAELFEKVNEEHPDLADRFIFVTGGAVTTQTRDFLENEGIRWMLKPVERGEIVDVLRSFSVAGGLQKQTAKQT